MNRNEIVLEILNVYDENGRLKSENERLNKISGCKTPNGNTLSNVEQAFIDLGKTLVIERAINPYRNINVSEDDNGKPCVTTFEKWLSDSLQKDKIPQNISYLEFIDFMIEDLKKYYDKKVKQALKDAGYDE